MTQWRKEGKGPTGWQKTPLLIGCPEKSWELAIPSCPVHQESVLGRLNAVSITQEATGKGWPQRWKRAGARSYIKASAPPPQFMAPAGVWRWARRSKPALRAAGSSPVQPSSARGHHGRQGVARPQAPRRSDRNSSLCIIKRHQAAPQNLMSSHCPSPKRKKKEKKKIQ